MAVLRIGQLIANGAYEIRETIGAGRFGTVYLAISTKAPITRIAVKSFTGDSRDPVSAIQTLHQESTILGALSHPNIIRIKEFLQEGDTPMILTEFLEGGNLVAYISRHIIGKKASDGLPAHETARIGLQLARALEATHGRGIFHGDLKPSNVCFRDRECTQAVLLDFAHARFVDVDLFAQTRGEDVATLAYLPPERTGFVKGGTNVSNDLYSLGITLYQIATGRLPFFNDDTKKMVSLILSEIPTPISKIKNFPEPLSDIIQKLIRKNPDDRYQTALGVAEDLDICLKSLEKSNLVSSFALGRFDQVRELNYKIPTVGRENELETLNRALDRSFAGHGESIFIGAPSGQGKSRISSEIANKAVTRGGRVIFAKYSEFERNVPLSAIGSALNDHSNWLRKQPAAIIEKWRERILSELGKFGNLITKRFAAYENLMPKFPALKWHEIDDESRVFCQTLAKFLSIPDPDSNGKLIFLDDLQWADTLSIQVLSEIVELGKTGSMRASLFVGTFRDDEVTPTHPIAELLKLAEKDQIITLGPLNSQETSQLVHLLLDERGDEIQKLAHATYRFAQGNPFYVYEYLRSTLTNGVFHRDEADGAWKFDEIRAVDAAMASDVSRLVGNRITKLAPLPKTILLYASVIGNVISDSDFCEILSSQLEALRSLLPNASGNESSQDILRIVKNQLQQENLIHNKQQILSFYHDKVREAAYEQVSDHDKLLMHHLYGTHLGKLLNSHHDTAQNSKSLFDAAFHISLGNPAQEPELSRSILHKAAKAAVGVFVYSKAREYLELARSLFPRNLSPEEVIEWIEINEILADTLAITGRLEESLELYDLALSKTVDRVKKAEIYAKKTECSLSLFRYQSASDAATKGLECLNVRILRSQTLAAVYIIAILPFFLCIVAISLTRKFRFLKIESKEEEIRWRLLLSQETPSYFAMPLVAIANHITNTIQLLFYEDNEYRNLAVGYWGVACGALGLHTLADRLFSQSIDYFDKNPSPILRSFLKSMSGYLSHFPAGEVKKTFMNMREALATLEGIDETFWRYVTLQGLVQIDFFAVTTGHRSDHISKLIALWERGNFGGTALGAVAKHFHIECKDDEANRWISVIAEAAKDVKNDGFATIDSCYAALSIGEIHFLRGEYLVALPHLEDAFNTVIAHFHRAPFCNYAAILYAHCLIRTNRPWKAIPPLALAWINIILNVKLFYPPNPSRHRRVACKIGL